MTAIQKKMSVQKIRSAVRKEREKTKSSRGRKPTPTILRALGVRMKTLRDETTGKLCFRKDEVGELSEEQRAQAGQSAESLSKRLEELVKLLGSSPRPLGVTGRPRLT